MHLTQTLTRNDLDKLGKNETQQVNRKPIRARAKGCTGSEYLKISPHRDTLQWDCGIFHFLEQDISEPTRHKRQIRTKTLQERLTKRRLTKDDI